MHGLYNGTNIKQMKTLLFNLKLHGKIQHSLAYLKVLYFREVVYPGIRSIQNIVGEDFSNIQKIDSDLVLSWLNEMSKENQFMVRIAREESRSLPIYYLER